MKLTAFCKTWDLCERDKFSRFEADSFEELRKTLVREFALLSCPMSFLICDEVYENVYSGIMYHGTFYFTLFNYKNL